MHFQNLFTATDIRQAHHHLAIETAGAQQRGIQYVRAVGSGDYNHAIVTFKTIHFDQQLVKCLLTLVVTTTNASATMATHGIDFVDENNARSLFLRLIEHVAYA